MPNLKNLQHGKKLHSLVWCSHTRSGGVEELSFKGLRDCIPGNYKNKGLKRLSGVDSRFLKPKVHASNPLRALNHTSIILTPCQTKNCHIGKQHSLVLAFEE